MSTTTVSSREIYLKIVEHSLVSNHWVTLVLKDDYRQGGTVKNINISFEENSNEVKGTISLYEGMEFEFSEIADIYS